jgi:hypothetical protein
MEGGHWCRSEETTSKPTVLVRGSIVPMAEMDLHNVSTAEHAALHHVSLMAECNFARGASAINPTYADVSFVRHIQVIRNGKNSNDLEDLEQRQMRPYSEAVGCLGSFTKENVSFRYSAQVFDEAFASKSEGKKYPAYRVYTMRAIRDPIRPECSLSGY